MTRGICNDIYNRINVTRHLAPLLTLTFLRLSLPSLFSSTFQSAFHFSSLPFVYLLVPACLFPLLNDFGNGFSTILPPTFSHSVLLSFSLSHCLQIPKRTLGINTRSIQRQRQAPPSHFSYWTLLLPQWTRPIFTGSLSRSQSRTRFPFPRIG